MLVEQFRLCDVYEEPVPVSGLEVVRVRPPHSARTRLVLVYGAVVAGLRQRIAGSEVDEEDGHGQAGEEERDETAEAKCVDELTRRNAAGATRRPHGRRRTRRRMYRQCDRGGGIGGGGMDCVV